MDLKRFSLGKEKETNSGTITTHNKEPIKSKKIFPHTLEPPTLRLDTDYGSTLYLKLCENSNKALYFEANLRYRDSGPSNRADHFGYSANIFPELDNELKAMSNVLDNDLLEFYYDLIILGRIYEAACKSGLSMDDMEFDRDMLNSFVNKSLEFYGYHDYNFDCNLAVSTLSKHTECYKDFLLKHLLDHGEKEFIVGKNNYILGCTIIYVYLQLDKDTVITLSSSFAVNIMCCYKETSSSIKEALAWILLVSEGFYVYNQKFVNTKLHYNNEILEPILDRLEQITPDNFAQCFKQS